MRRAIAFLALALALAACGAAPDAAPVASATHLGVQSNAGAPITLRLAPHGRIAFATDLRVSLRSELLGEPMQGELETRGVRRVTEVRPDGSLAIEEIDTATRYTITMMGNTQSGPEAPRAPSEPRRYVLGDRGRRMPDVAPPSPGASGATADAMQDRLEAAIDPLIRALEFPERPVRVGDQWGTDGTIDLAEVDPSMRGGATYRVAQRLDRIEGSGERRMAIVAFRASLDGEGAGAATDTPVDGGVAAELVVDGYYAVALADGFARSARARVSGEARLGPGDMMRFPLAGEIQWDAVPIDAGP